VQYALISTQNLALTNAHKRFANTFDALPK